MNKNELNYDINSLNDYCLLQIINFLDLKTKLRLHLTSKRLNRLIAGWFYHQKAFGDVKYSSISLCCKNEHKLDEYQFSLKSITENIFSNDWNLNIRLLNRLFQLATNIECLHFNCLDDESSINEKLIVTILARCSNLTCLSFGIGLQISSKCWSSIVEQLGNQLEHLQINRVNYVTLENVVKKCPNLKSLFIRFCPSSIACISYLYPKLRRLRITSMATIYVRNALFIDRNRHLTYLEDTDDDENTINLAINDSNDNSIRVNQLASRVISHNQMNRQAERYLNRINSSWYLNLIELRLNRVTVKSLTVLFNHCINLQILDLVLFFNRQSIVFENQDFIQLSHRLINVRLFSLDIFSKWNLVQLDNGLITMLNEWPKLEVLIVKRGLITENLIEKIKTNCINLKVISIEFCDFIPYNHRLNEITDKVIDSLIEFSKLTKLRLHFCGITDNGVIKLIENSRNLKYLDLFGCLKVTELSLKEISSKLNRVNRCDNIFLRNKKRLNLNSNLNSSLNSTEFKIPNSNLIRRNNKKFKQTRYNLRIRKTESFKSLESIDSNRSNESMESIESSKSENDDELSCKQFDTINTRCIQCNKIPQLFYLSINRTKIDLKKYKQLNRTNPFIFILNEDNELWNCSNYSN